MALKYVKEKAIKDYAKEKNRRVGYDFFVALDKFVETKIEKACITKNGSKITLDAEIAKYVGL